MGDFLIKPQQQQDLNCVSTCLAMLTGKPVDVVTEEFHDNYMSGHRTVKQYLEKHGVTVEHMYTTDDSEKEGGLFLLSAPSLNIEAATHYIICDWRDVESGCVIFDPNAGREGKKYYVCKWPEDLLENERNLLGFSYDFRIQATHDGG